MTPEFERQVVRAREVAAGDRLGSSADPDFEVRSVSLGRDRWGLPLAQLHCRRQVRGLRPEQRVQVYRPVREARP